MATVMDRVSDHPENECRLAATPDGETDKEGVEMSDETFSAITVMVVDDEAFMRKFVTSTLEAIGVGHVITAENGTDALTQLAETDLAVDLVICDIEMPEMTGYEFVRSLRYAIVPRFKDVPVLILTGHDTERNMEKARVHEINGYLVKPPTVDLLKAQIRNVLGFHL